MIVFAICWGSVFVASVVLAVLLYRGRKGRKV